MENLLVTPNRRLLAALLALPASAVAFYFATGLHPTWWLLWLAPIPVLLLAPRVSRRTAFGVSFAAYALSGLNLWNYFHSLLSTPIPVIALIIALPALAFAADVLLYRWMLRRSPWRAALIFPSFWVAIEFLNSLTSPHGTAGNLGYTQMNFVPILQIASVTGIWAISFCAFLFTATAAIVIGGHRNAGTRRRLTATVSLLLIAVLAFGFWRLRTPASTNTVKVGLLASDLRQNILADKPPEVLRLFREYAVQAEMPAAQGAKAILIPEKVAIISDSNLAEGDAVLQSTAAKTGAVIVVGVLHHTHDANWNEARLYFPDQSIRTYHKQHMLPAFEGDLTIGTERTAWQQPSGLWGITICKDMDFPALSREYGRDGTAVLLVPAWDFEADGWWHGRMAILRGVESGFSIVRSPNQGILTVSDNRGRVLAESSSNSSPFTSLIADVPVDHETTIYDRFGNWFGWANLVLLAWLLFTAFREQKLRLN
jgi:apolipoprotein N-acyltransferase